MKKLSFIILIMIMFLTINVEAGTCDSKEFKRLKEIAEKVEFSFDSEVVLMEEDPLCGECYTAIHDITAYNLNEEISVRIIKDYDSLNYKEFEYNDTKMATIGGFPSKSITVTIKGLVTNGCSGVTVLTKKIELPYYNPYFDTESCGEYSEFKYCKDKFIDKELTYTEFTREYNKYVQKENKEFSKIINIQKMYDYQNILIVIGCFILVLIIIAVILVIIKKHREKYEI